MNAHSSPTSDNSASAFTVVLLSLVALTFVLAGLAVYLVNTSRPTAIDPTIAALADARIQPVGEVYVGGENGSPATGAAATAAAEDTGPVDGAAVYQQACFSCHATGVAGAPKLGDTAAWESRLSQGIDVLYQHSLQGIRAMPPKGGFMNLSDEQVKAAVDHMVSQSQP
ncbi:cytochrome c5 family protein [Immundisolibacter sp.]|uniref:c-type cytochrome n=1 Tax=Immundisolibacter sp. TaxID=1934948 RepID=UPI00356A0E53